MGNRVHSEPKSARHGGRHSTIVRCRSATSASTRTSSRTCSGTRARHHRCTRATSVSGSDTPASLPPRSHPRCDVHWNPPEACGVGAPHLYTANDRGAMLVDFVPGRQLSEMLATDTVSDRTWELTGAAFARV